MIKTEYGEGQRAYCIESEVRKLELMHKIALEALKEISNTRHEFCDTCLSIVETAECALKEIKEE